MNDMFADSPIPVSAQMASVEREIAMRRRVYPRWVADKRMTQDKADAEKAAMSAVHKSLSEIGQLRAGVASKGALIDSISKLQGQRGVLVSLLSDCLRVLQTVDGDDADEDAQLRALRNRVSMVINESARSGRTGEFQC